MEEEQIRAPASCEQVPCLKLLSPYRKKERCMRTLEERICEGGNTVYMRPTVSHIRDKQRRICETSSLTHTKQAA